MLTAPVVMVITALTTFPIRANMATVDFDNLETCEVAARSIRTIGNDIENFAKDNREVKVMAHCVDKTKGYNK